VEVEAMLDWNRKVIEEFRANRGRVASFARQPLLLLTHTGAKTGKQRTNPLAYFRDGDRYVIVASKGGAPTNPDWYYNLLANPRVTIEVGIEQLAVTAEPVSPVERERLWAMVIETNPAFKEYEKKTRRTIPLMILTPSLTGSKGAGV
jgi:deazaflavin-dependent oxidoreductase (nitroreductase family)